jgi:hypothetical protein
MKTREVIQLKRGTKVIQDRMRRVVVLALTLTFAAFVHPPQSSAQQSPAAAACQVQWYSANGAIDGGYPSVAMDGPSRFFVMVYNRATGGVTPGISYRLGNAGSWQNPSLGPARNVQNGYNPGVAINTDGVLVEVHHDYSAGAVNDLVYYRIGKVNLNGSVEQTIEWSSPAYALDGGRNPQVAINDLGQVVEVHETNNVFGHKLYYHLGHLRQSTDNPNQYYLISDSGANGIEYNEGRFPQITLDNQGNVIEVHQASRNNDLHYRRGKLNNAGTRINWAPAASNGRYVTGNGRSPSIAQNGAGFVLEAHSSVQIAPNTSVSLLYGQINTSSNSIIDLTNPGLNWAASSQVGVSTNGNAAIAVYKNLSNAQLVYRLGQVNCP